MHTETMKPTENNQGNAAARRRTKTRSSTIGPKFETATTVGDAVFMKSMDAEPEIPWERIAAFVRQLTHELRNGLNSLDLESALMQELATDDEAHACAARARQQVRKLAEQLRSLSAVFQKPQPYTMHMPSRELFSSWRQQHEGLSSAPEIQWIEELGDEKISADEAMMATVFRELLSNAAGFLEGRPLTITARRDKDVVTFELREPKTAELDPVDWDRAFFTGRRGHYGLGLWSVRRLVEANGGTIVRRFLEKESALLTSLTLPIVD